MKTHRYILTQCLTLHRPLFLLLLLTVSNRALVALDIEKAATQTIMIQIKPIAILKINGSPDNLLISDNSNKGVSDERTTYSLVTNIDNMKIIASINDNMPAGTKLMVKLNSKNANSHGLVDISNSRVGVEILTGIRRGCEVNQKINYVFSAEPDVMEIPQQSRVITLTLTN